MSDFNLNEIQDFLVGLAQKAGPMITSANPSTVDTKKNSSDLVTETDKAVEDLISSSLKSAYPDYHFLGEETAKSGRLTPAPTFIVDPIDGTTNFVHAHPYISISMAFAYQQKPLVGVVYNPFTQHLYTAIRGQGAYLTAPKIPSSFPTEGQKVDSLYEKRKLPLVSPPRPLPDLSSAIVAVEYGNERHGNNWDCKISTFSALGRDKSIDGAMVQSVRSLGSAALNLCSVARGDIDVYWEGGCWAWDVAAGWVVLEEAGGMVVGGNKDEWTPQVDGRRYLALRAGAGKEIVEEFWAKIKEEHNLDIRVRRFRVANIARSSTQNLPHLERRLNLDELLDGYHDLLPSKAPTPSPSYRFIVTSYTAYNDTNTSGPSADNALAELDHFYGYMASQMSHFEQQNSPAPKPAMSFGSNRVWINWYGVKKQPLSWPDLQVSALRLQQYTQRGLLGKWTMVMWPPNGGQAVRMDLRVFAPNG
ncbi:MAG: hypothetical protein Q9174_005444 [Haloplaca sp. 1 TL-2023]